VCVVYDGGTARGRSVERRAAKTTAAARRLTRISIVYDGVAAAAGTVLRAPFLA